MNPANNLIPGYRIEKEISFGTDAKAFLLRVDANRESINTAIIPPEQKAQISQYHFQHDQDKRLLARSFLYEMLKALYGLTDFTFDYTEFQKPVFRVAPSVDFSFSYAGDYVFAGYAAGKQIGIDIECINESFPVMETAASVMCADELSLLHQLAANPPDACRFFFHLFTAKESIIKAFGTGLHYDVRNINTITGDRFAYNGKTFHYRDEGTREGRFYLAACLEPE